MPTISLAPLQGFTDSIFRNAIHQIIGGIDTFYSPYIRLQNDGTIKNTQWNETLPINNSVPLFIPQIIAANSVDFLKIALPLQELGYKEINWNLGCPYPMVTKQRLGSGLLAHPSLVEEILNTVLPKLKLEVSIKSRLGYSQPSELKELIPIINSFPLKEIIIHPRLGTQLYKGTVDLQSFEEIQSQLTLPVAYNGDICNLSDYNAFMERFPNIKHMMIGRGLLQNPFLALEIKHKQILDIPKKRELFAQFHNLLYQHYQVRLSGPSHLCNKMITLWEYFSFLFEDQRSIYKKIKKKTQPKALEKQLQEIILFAEMKNE